MMFRRKVLVSLCEMLGSQMGLERVGMGFGASGVRIDGLWRFAVQKVRPALLTSLLTKE